MNQARPLSRRRKLAIWLVLTALGWAAIYGAANALAWAIRNWL